MDNNELIETLNQFGNSFFATQIIVADGVVSRFLSFLASSEKMMSIVTDCTESNDYDKLFSEAVAKEGYNGLDFVLPENKKSLVALVTGLLFAMDCRKISIIDFVTKYFKTNTTQNSYFEFCDKVINPYFAAMASFLAEPSIVVGGEDAPQNKPVSFPEKMGADVIYWANEAINIIAGDNSVSESQRTEYKALLDGVKYASELGNTFLLNVTWIGIKYALGNYNPTIRELNNIYRILVECGVVEVNG